MPEGQPELLRDKFPQRFTVIGYVERSIIAEYCEKDLNRDSAYNCKHVWGRANKTTVEELLNKLREMGAKPDGAPTYEVSLKGNDYAVVGALLAQMFLKEAEKRAEKILSAFDARREDRRVVMNVDGRPQVFVCSGGAEKPLIFYRDLYVVRARGNTFPYRELLKQLGFTWDDAERTWTVGVGDSPAFPFFVNRLLAAAELATWLAEQGVNVCLDLRIIIALERRLEDFKKKHGSR